MKRKNIVVWIIGSAVLAVVGFIVVPKLVKKYGNRVYKESLKKEEIDFDNMGPEIVKKNTEEK